MPNDLFSPHIHDEQDDYREALIRIRDADALILAAKGIQPPWQESPDTLDADEMKVLTALDEAAGHVYYGGEDDRALADMIGFRSTGNLNAVMNKLVTGGCITFKTEYHKRPDGMRADRQRICMTHHGREMMERTEQEDEWGVDDE